MYNRGGLGPQGFRGPQGVQGPTGPQGLQGPTGYTGPQGSTGTQGLQGKGFIVYKSGEGYPNPDDFSDEHIGEFYLKKGGDLYCYIPETLANETSGDRQDFKYVGDVTDESVLVGPTGPVGTNGPPGTNGTKGDTGPAGINGTPGPTGDQGLKGDIGPTGYTGPAGTQGPTAADYQYTSTSITLQTGTTNKILNVVNTSNTVINITYNLSNNLSINKYSYDSFIYDGSTWYNIINNSQTEELYNFIYSFSYTDTTPIANIIANFASYIPIIKTSNISYTYTLRTEGTTITVNIKSDFVDDINGTTNDGLSFNDTTVRNFYNTNTLNLKIIQFGNIPLSRGGLQFNSITNLTIQDTQSPVVLSNTSFSYMFNNCTNFNSDISRWNTSNVTDMSFMFYYDKNYNENFADLSYQTIGASFNQQIGNWDVSKVTNMSYMFYNAGAFNQYIGNWNVSSVTEMVAMFYNARAFNQNIGTWNTSNVISMFFMFCNAIVFNNGQSAGGTTQKMNWTITFPGTPEDFSVASALTPQNTPNFNL